MRRAAIALASSLLMLAGCAVGPDYVPPDPEAPDAWHVRLTRGLAEGQADFRTWWTVLEDPQLTTLVGRASEGNLDLRQAVARVGISRGGLGIVKGQRVPQIDATGAAQRQQPISENVLGDPRITVDEDYFFSLGLDSSWELDIWGRVRRSVESAGANYMASVEDYRDVLVILYADVATNYVEVRTLQQRLVYARRNVELQEGAVRLTRDRRAAGLVGDLDVRQAELNLARTEALIPALEQRLAQTIHRLGVLTGQLPSALYAELDERQPIPTPPDQVVVGIPTELVRQRPDIRRAERQLASANARIGIATADLYPRFSLAGTFTVDSSRGSNLFTWGSRAFGIGPTFRWNLFDGGRVRARIRATEARTQQALAAYEQAVLQGFEDVENFMVAYVREQERRDALGRSVAAAREAVGLVDELYRLGLTDFQNVLDTQRLLAEQEDSYAESRGQVTQNLIGIYRALGGGWTP
jgi:NodT family efflux transporter outer membrane factor (OMF) lipoprotein